MERTKKPPSIEVYNENAASIKQAKNPKESGKTSNENIKKSIVVNNPAPRAQDLRAKHNKLNG